MSAVPASPIDGPRLVHELARERGRAEVYRDGVAVAAEVIEQMSDLLGRAGIALLLPVISAGQEPAAVEIAREILRVMRENRYAMSVLERAVDRMVLAEARVGRALAALPALEALAAKGSQAARDAVGAMREALG